MLENYTLKLTITINLVFLKPKTKYTLPLHSLNIQLAKLNVIFTQFTSVPPVNLIHQYLSYRNLSSPSKTHCKNIALLSHHYQTNLIFLQILYIFIVMASITELQLFYTFRHLPKLFFIFLQS